MDAKRRILLVEDDMLLAKLVEYKLVKNGYEVDVVADGESALNALLRQYYDVLLTDIMMPRLNGFQLIQRLQEQSEPRFGVWVVLSARSSEEDILRAFDLGAVDYINKPFSLDVLLARLQVALRHAKREPAQVVSQA